MTRSVAMTFPWGSSLVSSSMASLPAQNTALAGSTLCIHLQTGYILGRIKERITRRGNGCLQGWVVIGQG